MHRLVRAACASAALLLAAPALAQEAPQPSEEGSDIVVTGRELEEEVRAFVGALTPARHRDTIARFEWGVCPAVRGLTASQNDEITARLRAVAEAAGVRVERAGCTPNTLLVITNDKNRFIRDLAEARPWFFGDLTPRQIRALARSSGPAAAWQLKGLVGADGNPIYFDAGSGYYLNRSTQGASRGRPAARWVFEGSALVVERRALVGLNTMQLADYAAMRLFARTDPTRLAGNAPTILNILDAPDNSEVPLSMTQWDLAFLRGLYASPETNYATSQRSAIARQMREELEDGPRDGD